MMPREMGGSAGAAGATGRRLDGAGLTYGAATSRAFPLAFGTAAEVEASAPPADASPTPARSLASCAFAFARSLSCSASSLSSLACE